MDSSWHKSLETGNMVIDDQHHQLIDLLDELKNAPESNGEVLRMLDKVMDFMTTHFLCEKMLMTVSNYPSDAANIMVDQHEEFKTYMRLRILEFRQAETFDVTSFQTFVKNFIEVHEGQMDRQLADWIRQQHETARAA